MKPSEYWNDNRTEREFEESGLQCCTRTMNKAAGNWAKSDSRLRESYGKVPELGERENEGVRESYSQWHDLFGTPERAARTLECSCHLLYGLKVDGFVACIGCPVYDNDADVDDCCYDKLLEWLRGDAR